MSRARVVIAVAGIAVLCGIGAWLTMRPAAPRVAPEAGVPSSAPASATNRPSSPAEAPSPTAVLPPVEKPREPARPKAEPKKTAAAASAATAAVRREAAPAMGTLHVVADVPEASVFIDRKYIGAAPVTARNITPGPHHLNVSAAGYDGVSEDLDVAAGPREVAVSLKTVRLAASVGVVHKHAIGSCAGTLRASPQDIAYETANKNDGFAVPLTDIESFEVDYLNKNLKLKVRQGKTYNFTDPDGNADRLFVFHRDVDRVRQRLADGR